MTSPIQISVAQLSRLVGTPAAPTLLDVRTDEDFADDPRILPAAIRHPFNDIEAAVPILTGKTVVVYCQRGKKISEGAAALLRCHNVSAEVLESGHFGWRDAGEPLINTALIPRFDNRTHSLWVTRLRPKIDRIACPWLIRRFVDPNAQFLFVAASEVPAVAEKFDATPFDIEETFWSHRGDECSFDTFVNEFGLQTPAISRLTKIVRGADTNNLDLAPECAGLLAASLGLSRLFNDDLEQLDAGLLLYDAMYRWARDATREKHDWPDSQGRGKTPAT